MLMAVAVAVAPTANSGTIAIRKYVPDPVPIHFIKTAIILTLAFAGTACNAFGGVPIHRMVSKTTIATTKTIGITRRTSFKNSIFDGDNIIALKATSVDQDQDRGNDLHIIHTDQTMLRTNNINLVAMILDRLEDSYVYSERHIKCPFFRRRCGDILDTVEGFVRFFLIRPYFGDSSSRLGPSLSCKSLTGEGQKTKHLAVSELMDVLRKDWRASKERGLDPGVDCDLDEAAISAATIGVDEKGYYVTGKMSTHIYRGDCEFLSPDPDLPLKGLRKYIGVASHLFDSKASYSKLLSLGELDRRNNDNDERKDGEAFVLKAEWKMSLTLNLPWKPQLSEFSGSTLYFIDEDHLICRHQEAWDMSVLEAFVGMLSISNSNSKEHNNKTPRCPLAFLFTQNSPQQHSSM